MIPIYVYDYPKGDYVGLCQFFNNSDLTCLYSCSDVNQVWTVVRDLIITGMDQLGMQYFSCCSDKYTEIKICDLEPFSKIQSQFTKWLAIIMTFYINYVG